MTEQRSSTVTERAPGYCVWCNSSGHAATTECYEAYATERDRPRTDEELALHLEQTRNRLTDDDIRRLAAALRAPAQTAPEPANRLPTLDEYRNSLVKECAQIAEPWSGFAGVDKMGTQDREIIKVREEIAAAIMNLSVPSTDFCARPQLMQWQPIDTAPRDRTAIWVLLNGRPYIGYCEPADEIFNRTEKWFVKASFQRRDRATNLPDEIYGTYHYDAHPTHWMPLPDGSALPSTDRPSHDSKLEAYRKALEEIRAMALSGFRGEEDGNSMLSNINNLVLKLFADEVEVRKVLAAGG